MVVRPVAEEEHNAWHRMRVELYPHTSEENHRLEMDAVLSDPSIAQCFVALQDNKIVGFLEVGIREWAEGCETKNVGYLESLYVDEFFRRSGVAKSLIRAGEHWSRDHGAVEIASDADVDNEEGLVLHQQMRYDEVGRSAHFKKALL